MVKGIEEGPHNQAAKQHYFAMVENFPFWKL